MICAPAMTLSGCLREGRGGGTAGERCEDGADDHTAGTGKLGVCAVGSSGRAQSPRGAAASNARQFAVMTSRCSVLRTDPECNLNRIMIPIRPMFEALTVAPGSLPVGAFPLLEGIFPPGSSDSEKATCLLSLFQMALQSEDECLSRSVDCESFSQTLLSLRDDLCTRSEASGCPHGSRGVEQPRAPRGRHR